jgi:hypothetical protein
MKSIVAGGPFKRAEFQSKLDRVERRAYLSLPTMITLMAAMYLEGQKSESKSINLVLPFNPQ